MMDKFKFPKGFYWGASTSAHQVEGNNHSDWSEWEKQNAERLVQNAKRKKWPEYILKAYPNPLQEENYISGHACDHYHRFREDFDIAKSLGHNAHRFSIEWSRVEPEEGEFNEREIKHYQDAVQALRERNIEPFVTLWHWTLPLWLGDQGGVSSKKFPFYFARFAERMAKEFKAEVKFWITLNETNVYTGQSYFLGKWPPSKCSIRKYFLANHHLSLAHKSAYELIKTISPKSQIGVAHNAIYFSGPFGFLARDIWNHWFLRSLRNTQDFIGINYYYSNFSSSKRSDIGWSINPGGFHRVLKEMARYQKPIYVTENGVADARDLLRSQFIREHVFAMHQAINEGVDVRGYFYWSLSDNFEWDKGFWPRFGLVEIDYRTMERKVRPSAWEYKKIIQSDGFTA